MQDWKSAWFILVSALHNIRLFVLTDIFMPKMSGVELTEELRRSRANG